jgi:hypothetical protein
MVGCSRQFWHGHIDGGAIIAYAPKGGVLLDDNGYMQKLPEYHNLFWAERSDRAWIGHTRGEYERRRAIVGSWGPSDFQVRGLTGQAVAQMATLACDAPHGLPIRAHRTVLLSRKGPLIVYDRVVPLRDGLVGSTLWHAQTVHRMGRGWAEVSVDEFRGMNGPWMPNAPGNLLIVNPLDAGEWETLVLDNDDAYGAQRDRGGPPTLFDWAFVCRACLFRRRALLADEPNHFVTVLLPSDDIDRPDEAVRLVEAPTPSVQVVAVGEYLFVANDTQSLVQGGWGAGDARFLWYEGDGLLAHRMHRIELPGLGVESGPWWADIEVTIDASGVRGAVSAERETRTSVRWNGREASFVVRGITPVRLDAG